MKGYIKSLVFFLSLLVFLPALAADVDRFEVTLEKEAAKVGEALDMTITAVDKDGNTVEDYVGEILVFSESDNEAEFPNDLSKNSYKFTTTNEGSVKFENAVQFKKVGVQDVYVYDLVEEDILGVAEVTISEDASAKNVEIEILSPENGVTLGNNVITVSGKTQKNHQVQIILNETQKLPTTSNAEGIFELEVENLKQGENKIKAQVLSADDEIIGESSELSVKINADIPSFKSIKITPEGEVEAETEISIEVVSNAGLTDVQVLIHDVITKLKEGKDGIYTGKTRAPKDAGKYGVDVVMKDEFAHEAREANAAILIVTPKLLAAVETPVAVSGAVLKELDLTITDIQVVELKTKSVLTWKALPDAQSYNVYKKISDTQVELVENVKEARFEIDIIGDEVKYDDFAIKAVGKTASGETIEGDLSKMTKVKTGPELYIILAFLALLLSAGIFYLKRDRFA